MSLRWLVWALHEAPVTDPTELLVLVALADYADETGRCWPSHRTIAAVSRLSISGVRGPMARLEAAGLVDVHRPARSGRGHHSTYELRPDGDGLGGPAPRGGAVPEGAPDAPFGLSTGAAKRARNARERGTGRALTPINARPGARVSLKHEPTTAIARPNEPRMVDGRLFLPGSGWVNEGPGQ